MEIAAMQFSCKDCLCSVLPVEFMQMSFFHPVADNDKMSLLPTGPEGFQKQRDILYRNKATDKQDDGLPVTDIFAIQLFRTGQRESSSAMMGK